MEFETADVSSVCVYVCALGKVVCACLYACMCVYMRLCGCECVCVPLCAYVCEHRSGHENHIERRTARCIFSLNLLLLVSLNKKLRCVNRSWSLTMNNNAANTEH